MATDDLSSSSHEFPFLVYHTSDEDGDMYFNIENQRCGVKNISWFRNNIQLDANSGWLLQFSFDTRQLSLLHHCTGEELPIPSLPDRFPETQILDYFVCRLRVSSSGCHIVAIHRIERIYYLYRPGRTDWDKYEFSVPKPADPNDILMVNGAAVGGGNIYVMVAKYLVVISNVHRTPKARCKGTRGPWGVSNMSPPTPQSYNLHFLLESDGNLYEVMVHLFDNEYESRPRTVTLTRLNQSSRMWEVVTSIENKVFLLGEYYSAILPASTSVQGDMIYLSHRGNTYAFNVPSRSLTAYFHCQRQILDEVPPSWLLLGRHQYEVTSDHMEICCSTVSQLSMDDEFDHPINISSSQPARYLLAKKGGVVTWCPKTPWLLFRHGHDSTLKFFDPCSSSVYALDIPELLNKALHHSRNGWVLASNIDRFWFFINIFSKQKIDLPAKLSPYIDTLGMSSSPASPDCLVFTISNNSETDGSIDLCGLADDSITTLTYTSSLPFDVSPTSPVYHNGVFYCLGMNGNLGVYDPIGNSWSVKDRPRIAADASFVSTCYLIESDSKLYSVFMDVYDNPIGVYCLDLEEEKWNEVKDMKDKTIFIGKEGSFIVPAPEKRMGNKIYLPVFEGKNDLALRAHEIGVQKCLNLKSFTTREYVSMWIEPKGVIFQLDQASGTVNHPTIRLDARVLSL